MELYLVRRRYHRFQNLNLASAFQAGSELIQKLPKSHRSQRLLLWQSFWIRGSHLRHLPWLSLLNAGFVMRIVPGHVFPDLARDFFAPMLATIMQAFYPLRRKGGGMPLCLSSPSTTFPVWSAGRFAGRPISDLRLCIHATNVSCRRLATARDAGILGMLRRLATFVQR